ncbi:hypothetical protein [Psychroserpens sp. NJDZ02]|uniref:hypothetical protein n=1 Tax=Psychroserpens sp. NJDZ02 TaxID=2570561 RepID=UPI0010A8CDD7|nr:hypothetical protein [Psychroserpens sp. NJDZ02]QCE42404.1 hypothetical protein E9099_13645 [Psychroserpens sp. NJDZ02]
MALVFDKKNIEVKFLSEKPIDENVKKELIVYPVLAHKIYAPVIDDLNLNIFQKHILSILNKGNFSVDEIAKWLSLDLDLVKTILAELANKSLLDINSMSITNKGKELIEGSFSWFNNIDSLKKDIRYIFQDVFTQELFPIILPFDNFQVNIKLSREQLTYKTKGKKDSFFYELIAPKDLNLNNIRKPETQEILDTIKKQADKYIPNSKNDLKEVANAVNYLDEEPDLFYCAMWISSEQNNKQEENIEISDPFNIYDDAYWLRNTILKAQSQNETLKEVIHSLVYNIEEEEKIQASEFMIGFDKEIENELNQIFDFTLKLEYPLLYSAIKEYYFDVKFYKVHKDTSHLKNAFRKSQIVVETLFKLIFENYKEDYGDVISSQTYNGGRFHAFKEEIKTKINTINPNSLIPNWYHREFKGVESALKNPDRASLRALFIAGVMASVYNSNNPIYKILKEKNNFSVCVENIAESRNKVGHKYTEVADNEIDKYYKDAIAMQKDIEEIIEIFLKN